MHSTPDAFGPGEKAGFEKRIRGVTGAGDVEVVFSVGNYNF